MRQVLSRLRLSRFLLLFFCIALHTSSAFALTVFSGSDKGVVLNGDLVMLHDSSGRLGIEDVAAPERASAFRPGNWRDFAPGFTSDVIWLRLTVYNPWPADGDRYLEIAPPRLQDVRLYKQGITGSWQELHNGTLTAVAKRDIPSRLIAFPLRLAPGETQTLYVRVASANAIMLHARLWHPQLFHQSERNLDLVNGLQYGAVLLLAFYGLVLFITARERALLFFVLMLLGSFGNDASLLQYGYQYLWTESPDWNLRAPGILAVPILLGSVLLILRLLDARQHFPSATRISLGLLLVLLCTVPLMLWLDYRFWAAFSYIFTLLSVLFIGAIVMMAAWRRVPQAKLVLGAFVLTWVLTLLRLAQIFGVLPHDILIDYSQNWAILLSGGVIVLVIMTMLRKLHAEREAAEHRATEARLQAEQDVILHTRELRMAKEMAEASSHAKSAFLAQLSHELRTPLHSILGYSGLILNESTSASDRRRVEAVQQSGRHLLALIDELLDYARLEANKLTLDRRPVYLRALLDATLQEVQELAKAQGIALHLDIDPALPSTLMLDPVRLRQVLLNLLVNACRHSQASELSLQAALLPTRLPRLQLVVRDNGVGIADAERERLFRPFEQGQSGREGLGLGLSIAQQFVQLKGGELVCVAAEGGGTEFRFSFPLEEAPESQVQPLRGEVMPRRYIGPVRRVLVVDDIAENRALLADVLATLGFDVALAEGGQSALQCLGEQAFDLVITDQLMPDISGWEVLRLAREAGHAMPFILLSGAAPVLPDNWPPRLVFAVILMKPAEPARLAEAIASALRLEWEAEAAADEALVKRPPEADLRFLREAAAEGRISDIEDWVEQALAGPEEYRAYALAIREAVRRLDLPGLQTLASS